MAFPSFTEGEVASPSFSDVIASSPSSTSVERAVPHLARSTTKVSRNTTRSFHTSRSFNSPGPLATSRLKWSRSNSAKRLGADGRRADRTESTISRTSVASVESTAPCNTDAVADEDAISIPALMNNKCASALESRGSVYSAHSKGSSKSATSVDWQDNDVQEKLQEIHKITRQLFNAFEGAEAESSSLNLAKRQIKRWSTMPAAILKFRWFTGLSLMLTVYALYGPDGALLCGQNSRYNGLLASINTVVLGFFLVESSLQYYAIPGYACSGRFWVDVLAACSMIGDTLLGYKFLSSGTAAAGRGTRALRMLRMGGRSSRFLRILKNVRLIQGIRILVKLFKQMDRDRQKLAAMLFNERLFRLFQYLDGGDKRHLSEVEEQFFFMALQRTFPTSRAQFSWMHHNSFSENFFGGFRYLRVFIREFIHKVHLWFSVHGLNNADRISLHQNKTQVRTFHVLLKEFVLKPESKNALKACEEDLERVERAADLFNETTAKLMLKVSVLVLIVLCLVPLLEVPTDDRSDAQSLASLDMLAGEVGLSRSHELCGMVQQYCSGTKHKFLMLGLHHSTQWAVTCHLSGCHLPNLGGSQQVDLLEVSRREMDDRGLQPHEYKLCCYPDTECPDRSRSVALFDISSEVRARAVWSILYTSAAVILMIAMVIFFSSDLRQLKVRVLLPMWDLLDDMAAMKILEFARARDLTNMGEYSRSVSVALSASRVLHRDEGFSARIFRRLTQCVNPCLRCMKSCTASASAEPEEITALKESFGTMRQATRSWAKYVPTTLVKRLVVAGMEAQLCVCEKHVTVLFIDVLEFDNLCKGLEPREVLMFLCHIQEAINDVIEKAKGTTLEMIGDEMLAVFNAPLEVANHSTCAIRAAVAAAEAVQNLNEFPGVNVQIRCGVHTSPVLAGNIGSERRLKYGVLGDGVNTAARLKSLNSQFGTKILVSEHTMENLDAGEMLSRPVGHLILKGRSRVTKTWEVVGRTSDHSPQLKEMMNQHKRAFQLYLARYFEESRALFNEAHHGFASMRKHDLLSRRLALRCEDCIKNPPPIDGWDGSEILGKK